MGCVASRKLDEEEEEDVVLVCRERKRQLKKALESRSALADSQCKYNNSLYALSAALRLFVARYSSPSSPFLITFNPSSDDQKPTSDTLISSEQDQKQSPKYPKEKEKEKDDSESDEEEEEEEEEMECECKDFYGQEMGFSQIPNSPPPRRDFQWDFFSPFDVGVSGGFGGEDEDLGVVREKEGIPDLEEDEGERFAIATEERGENVGKNIFRGDLVKGDDDDMSQGEQKCLIKVVDTPNDGRELLEALKDVVDLFLRGYDSGLDVSRMLETNMVQAQSTLEDTKENPNKLIRSIPRSRSTSSTLSWSSSCKSLLTTSSSKSSSTWTELKSDVFDSYGGMESGSHSLTLGRLYAWEKKLYEEVKSAEETRKIYKQKCSQLRNQEAKRDGLRSCDKTAAEVKHLYTRNLVSIKSAESISERIKNLRDQELQPQLVELLRGLMRNWKIMLEMHETQNKIMYQVKSFDCPTYGKFCNDSHRLATLRLETELQNWQACFDAYVSSQKAYVEALAGWLSKFVITPQTELCLNGINAPPLLAMCHDWLVRVDTLPDKAVTSAMKSFRKDIRALLVKQGEEQQQKRKVEGLAKELDRKVLALQRVERRVLESKISGQEGEIHVRSRVEYLTEKKEQLEAFRKRVDAEKVKHQNSVQETQQIAVSGFQTGFSALFESLAEFSRAAVKMYGDQLVTFSENSVADEKIKFQNLDLKAMKT